MVKIIDATLTMLDSYQVTKAQILEFLSLLRKVSIHSVVLSVNLYYIMQHALPEEMEYYLELPYGVKKETFHGVSYFISTYCDGSGDYIKNIQMNELSEVKVIARLEADTKIRLTGLDDMLLYEDADIYQNCMEQLRNKTLILYPENSYYCATAIAVNFLMSNNKGIVMTTFNGIGNKAETEQVLLAMWVCRRYKKNQDFAGLKELRKLFESITECKMPKHAPVIGENIFYVESGIHVDGVLKRPSNYELYPPELVGAERKILLGKQSGIASIRYQLDKMQMKGHFNLEQILERIKRQSLKRGRSITEDEFRKIVDGCDVYETVDQSS